MILVGAIEFLCAQIPYSMKGLIVGIFYGSVVLASVLNRTISHIFTLKTSIWEGKAMFSCEFWYLQIKLIFLLIMIISSLLVAVYYRKRKRDDVLPNEQIFAERYYSKKLQCT
jgi:formate hydrogenlyase subunit 3/multisubunit Na+/H+ antiporter MnhD subunit